MTASKDNGGQVLSPAKEFAKLYEKIAKQQNPDEAVQLLRQLAIGTPSFLSAFYSTTEAIRNRLIEKISHGVSRVHFLVEMDLLKKELDYDAASSLERLLIDHILTVQLRLIHAEHNYNECVVGQSVPLARGEYLDNLLCSTQARFLRAIETLARVRRLARNTPALQLNICDGGKQVNVQGDAPIEHDQQKRREVTRAAIRDSSELAFPSAWQRAPTNSQRCQAK